MKRRRNVLSQVKGYRFGRSKKEKEAKEAIAHAGNHAFAHRRRKKGDFRRIWTIRLNAAIRSLKAGSYSTFINKLKKKGVTLDRKVLSTLAKDYPEVFERVTNEVK